MPQGTQLLTMNWTHRYSESQKLILSNLSHNIYIQVLHDMFRGQDYASSVVFREQVHTFLFLQEKGDNGYNNSIIDI